MSLILTAAVLIGLSANAIRPGRLPLLQDWSAEARLSAAAGDNILISLEDAKALFLAQQAVFLDARAAEVFQFGHIPGARNLPWDEFDTHFPGALADLPQDTLLITYCDGGSCELGKMLALALRDLGYPNVRVLLDGWGIWQQSNLPVAME